MYTSSHTKPCIVALYDKEYSPNEPAVLRLVTK